MNIGQLIQREARRKALLNYCFEFKVDETGKCVLYSLYCDLKGLQDKGVKSILLKFEGLEDVKVLDSFYKSVNRLVTESKLNMYFYLDKDTQVEGFYRDNKFEFLYTGARTMVFGGTMRPKPTINPILAYDSSNCSSGSNFYLTGIVVDTQEMVEQLSDDAQLYVPIVTLADVEVGEEGVVVNGNSGAFIGQAERMIRLTIAYALVDYILGKNTKFCFNQSFRFPETDCVYRTISARLSHKLVSEFLSRIQDISILPLDEDYENAVIRSALEVTSIMLRGAGDMFSWKLYNALTFEYLQNPNKAKRGKSYLL